MNEWQFVTLDSVAEIRGGIQRGPHRAPGANAVRYLTVAHVLRNRILIDDPRHFEVTPEELDRWRLEAGDVLIIEGNGSANQIGRAALFRGEIKDCVHQNHIIRIRPVVDRLSSGFLNHYLNSPVGQAAVQAQSWTTSGLRTLSVGRVKQLLIPRLRIGEQDRIAEVINAWDSALGQLEVLIAAKEKLKKGLVQRLILGRRRLLRYAKGEPWQRRKLGELFERVQRPISGDPEHVLSITAGVGFVDQRRKFSRVIAGKNLEKYVLLREGEFAYNKGNSDRYPCGCIYRLEEFREGAVPNVWISFRAHSPDADPLYYKHFFLSGELNRQLIKLINSGVRNDGLLNLNAESFFSVEIPVPTPREQKELGELFESISLEHHLLCQQRDAIERQKLGLMQRLLTGRIRVKAP